MIDPNLLSPATLAGYVLDRVMDALAACQRPGFREQDQGDAKAGHMVTVASFAIDECCPGLLVVAPERTWRTTAGTFPAEAASDNVHSDELIACDLLVALARCWPTLDDDGNAPPLEAQERAADGVLADAAVIWRALASDSLIGRTWPDDDYERGTLNQTFLGPEGGCIIIETRVTLGVPSGTWCLECE